MVNIVKAFRRSVRTAISRSYNWFVKVIIRLGSDRNIWEGTYNSANEIKINNNDWEYFTNWQFTEVRKIIENTADVPNPFFIGDRALFPLFISIISQNKPDLTILDIGGGTGFDFLSIVHCSKTSAKVHYYIVEIPKLLDRARVIFSKYPNVKFFSNCHDMTLVPDVILFNSTLQYFEDYKEKLIEISRLNPEYIVFIRLSGGTFNSYISKQVNIPDVQTPYWFVNIYELNDILENAGYNLIYRSRGDCEYYQGNFPESYRMKRTWNLIFRKKK